MCCQIERSPTRIDLDFCKGRDLCHSMHTGAFRLAVSWENRNGFRSADPTDAQVFHLLRESGIADASQAPFLHYSSLFFLASQS